MAAAPDTEGGPHVQAHRHPAHHPLHRRPARRRHGVAAAEVAQAPGRRRQPCSEEPAQEGPARRAAGREQCRGVAREQGRPAPDARHHRCRPAAIGVAADEQSEPPPASITPRGSKRSVGRRRKASESKGATAPSSKAKRTASPAALRPGTKQALLVDLLQRKGGATIAEVVKATGWQPHSVRGAISGALKKKLGLAVASDKVEGRGRVYRIAAKR